MKYLFFLLVLANAATAFSQKAVDSFYTHKLSEPGVKMIPVYGGKYKVFTQKKGDGPVRLLLLHGGPGQNHEYFENFPANLPGVTVYYYDQLGTYYSDQPDDSSIWKVDRFVEEVEEVRRGLGIDHFYLLGHSWGGLLAEMYTLKYARHVKGLVLSNIPGFPTKDPGYFFSLMDSLDGVARQRALEYPEMLPFRAQLDTILAGKAMRDSVYAKALQKRYTKITDSLFGRMMYYTRTGPVPEPLVRSTRHLMEYPPYFNFFEPDYVGLLPGLRVPVLLLGSKNDFLKDERYHSLKDTMKNTKVLVHLTPQGAHFPMWDDTEDYFSALKKFLRK